MQYVKFRISNYRGIEEAVIDLPGGDGSRVTTLIGLNESGKTTILEAIYSFSPDPESKALYAETVLLSEDPSYYIPRREFSNFNGDITVEAEVAWEAGEKAKTLAKIRSATGIEVNPAGIPDKIRITSTSVYKSSKRVDRTNLWSISLDIRTGKQQKFRAPSREEKSSIFSVLLGQLPSIAYFPTFVFSFPERIYLKGGPDKAVDRFYKKIFQAILDAGGEGHNIKDHIVGRYEEIHTQGAVGKAIDAAAAMIGARSATEMIKQTVDKAADTVSDVIIAKWDEIFRHSPLKKEISIDAFEEFNPGDEESEEEDAEHAVWVEFKVKDSGTRYHISDRSLGFRWFFCFLLFTRFMSEARDAKRILFLFDEPASNLHAKAQEKLLESFSDIARYPNSLIFSTHSHYMIEPTWLERAYVVKNDAIDYSDVSGEQKRSKGVRIEAIRYRDFVSQADDSLGRMTYFQPVLDRLDIKPSQLDVQTECVVVEGKSDFHILTYIKRNYLKSAPAIVPAFGATTMRPVVGILRGWASRFLVLLDSDDEGTEAAKTYSQELDLGNEIALLGDLVPGAQAVESLLSREDKERIRDHLKLDKLPTKKSLSRAFQEANAGRTKLPLTRVTINKIKTLLQDLQSRLSSLPSQQ
jgi:ABC-type Na+ transport system ATPase subunit NatA/5S rRNA maturation endonuclease (ribonuclease M5)